MKKLLPLILLVVVGVSVWVLTKPPTPPAAASKSTPFNPLGAKSPGEVGDGKGGPPPVNPEDEIPLDEAIEGEDAEVKPASEAFATAEDAINAVKQGADSYDDLVLEQFTQPPENCVWCPTFYQQLRDLMLATDTKTEQKSFYGEIMAISGRPENIAVLIEAIKNSQNPQDKATFSEALELTIGNDQVVKYLGEQVTGPGVSPELKESLVAAMTNQGSRTAAESLFALIRSENNPDGYYSVGIGPSELVPDEATIPFLEQEAMKKDQFSPHAVKAMLNGGMMGLKRVVDMISGSSDVESDRKLLTGASDHVSFDDQTEAYLKDVVENSKNQALVEFAKKVLDDFAASENAGEDDVPLDGGAQEEIPVSE